MVRRSKVNAHVTAWADLIRTRAYQSLSTMSFSSTLVFCNHSTMTTTQLANQAIQAIKTWPVEARQSQSTRGPKTCWDEYKEQVQYEEYDSFEVMDKTIRSMVNDEVLQLSDGDIESIGSTIGFPFINPTDPEKRLSICEAIMARIKNQAEIEEIEYLKPEIDYIKYDDLGICAVARVLKQVSPEDYLLHVHSEETGPAGEDEITNLTTLDQACNLERITLGNYRQQIKKIKQTNFTPNNR